MIVDESDIEQRAARLVTRIARLVRLEDDSCCHIHEKLFEMLLSQFRRVRRTAIRRALKPSKN